MSRQTLGKKTSLTRDVRADRVSMAELPCGDETGTTHRITESLAVSRGRSAAAEEELMETERASDIRRKIGTGKLR